MVSIAGDEDPKDTVFVSSGASSSACCLRFGVSHSFCSSSSGELRGEASGGGAKEENEEEKSLTKWL